MNFNKKLKLYRKRACLSQRELGALLGISRQSVLKWESGHYCPQLCKINAICKALNVSPDDLLSDSIYNSNSCYNQDIPDNLSALSIGKNITYLRNAAVISPNELCVLAGVTRQTVTRWESGDAFPEISNVISLARIFGTKVSDILS